MMMRTTTGGIGCLLVGLGILNPRPCPAADASGGAFSLFSPAFSGIGTNSLADVAVRFSGGIIGGASLDPDIVHKGNPAAKAYRYQLGPYVQIKHVPKKLVPKLNPFFAEAGTAKELIAESALVLQGLGDPQPGMVNWPRQFPPYPLVVPDDPGWLVFLDATLPKTLAHFDGLFLDSMGTTPVVTRYLVAKPINPKTHKPYTIREWQAAEMVMLDHVNKLLKPGQTLLMQGLVNGETFFGPDSLRPLLAKCDGGMAESIYRGPQTGADQFPAPETWLKEVRMIAEVEAQGKAGYYWTKNWVEQTEAQRTQWLRYTLCSHLLGAGMHSYFNYDSHNEPVPKGRGNNANAAEYYPEYDQAKQLGKATAPMSQVRDTGVYRRPWENGWVYVNPTAAAVRIQVEGTFGDLDGQPVSGSLILPVHSGQILVRNQAGRSD